MNQRTTRAVTNAEIKSSPDQLFFALIAKWKTVACNDWRSVQVDERSSKNEHVKYLVTLKLPAKQANDNLPYLL